MKFTSAAAGAMLAGLAAAHPHTVEKRQAITATDLLVLQFALTLEHLENYFYQEALGNFTAAQFAEAGYGADYYNNLQYIAHDETVHVQALEAAITASGNTPVAACSYNFAYPSVLSFITLSSVLEGVGTSAYLGAAGLISSKYYLTVAGSILATEALHTSFQRNAVNEVPMANPFETPLDPMSVYTLAAMFITSCPASNYQLGFTPFPTLTLDASVCTCEEPNCSAPKIQKREPEPVAYGGKGGYKTTTKAATTLATKTSSTYESTKTSSAYSTATGLTDTCIAPKAGATVMFTAASAIPAGSYVTFVSGLSVVSVPGTITGTNITAAIPAVAEGQTYVFVSSSDQETTFSDAAVLFGPAILEVFPGPPTNSIVA